MDVHGKRVVVMGLGCFSGGVSAARFMARRGAEVIVTDMAGPEKLTNSIAALADVSIRATHLGGHRPEDFRWADMVVASPAVPLDSPFLHEARQHGAQVTSEMNLFFELCPARVVGVTGSNGKSTTAAMIHAILREAGRSCWLGGNIGRSLLEQLAEIRPSDIVVLELSSFQLEHLDELGRSPPVALVTNLTPNHLDRHPTLTAYRSAKQAILRRQTPADFAILNADDADVRTWPTQGASLFFGLEDHGRDGSFLDGNHAVVRRAREESEFRLADVLHLPGVHNQSNALAAMCCAAALVVDTASMCRGLGSFRTLPHRLELVEQIDGRRFYDDSIATTPESTLAALDALSGPIWLIAGGHDKGLDLELVARRIADRVNGVALLGQTASTLDQLIGRYAQRGSRPQVQQCGGMEEAVRWCFGRSRPGDAVLLSPACASFGMFQNFVERAEVFCRAVRELRAVLRRAG